MKKMVKNYNLKLNSYNNPYDTLSMLVFGHEQWMSTFDFFAKFEVHDECSIQLEKTVDDPNKKRHHKSDVSDFNHWQVSFEFNRLLILTYIHSNRNNLSCFKMKVFEKRNVWIKYFNYVLRRDNYPRYFCYRSMSHSLTE